MSNVFDNYIDGQWATGEHAVPNVNPSDTSDIVGDYASGSVADAQSAIAAAKAAFPKWSRSAPLTRHDILMRASQEILSRKDELGRLLSREEGKTLAEGIGEVVRASQAVAFMAGEALRIPGEHITGLSGEIGVDVTREPLGVIGLITPWNFPIAIPAWKIAPALAYGNTVVFKPAELVPASAWALVDIYQRAGLPPGVLNLVMGKGSTVGQALLDHKDVAGISFTGSVETGRRIAASCVASPVMKRMQLEMGGKNPLVVLDDANMATAVECAVTGAFYATGQRCTASSRFIVTEGIHDKFVAAVTERLKGLNIDHALNPATQIGPVVDESQLNQDLSYIKIGREEGAKLHWGGQLLERATKGFFLQPALFTNVTPQMRIAREEIFGPVASVVRVKNYDEALAIANDTEFGLTAGICTTNLKYATDFKRNAEAGVVKVNLSTSGLDYHVPFGGRKGSSYGPRELGRYAVEFFTIVKSAYTASE